MSLLKRMKLLSSRLPRLSPRQRWAVSPLRLSELSLPDEELSVARLCDGVRDLAAIVSEAALGERRVQRLLARLAAEGAIVALPTVRVRKSVPRPLLAWARREPVPVESEPRFSGDEEAFFTTPLPEELPDPLSDPLEEV